jgi:hypothetical protein
VAKVGRSKAGGTISQQAAVHPWLAADAHVKKQTKCQSALRNITEERKPHIQSGVSLELWIRYVKQVHYIEAGVFSRH